MMKYFYADERGPSSSRMTPPPPTGHEGSVNVLMSMEKHVNHILCSCIGPIPHKDTVFPSFFLFNLSEEKKDKN